MSFLCVVSKASATSTQELGVWGLCVDLWDVVVVRLKFIASSLTVAARETEHAAIGQSQGGGVPAASIHFGLGYPFIGLIIKNGGLFHPDAIFDMPRQQQAGCHSVESNGRSRRHSQFRPSCR